MNDITRILNTMNATDPQARERLLAAVYEELRRLARHKMATESPDHTLQPTALVHEAWLRLITPGSKSWENRAHFFSSAAEAMRRILVEHARRRQSQKRGGGAAHEELVEAEVQLSAPADELLAVHDALDRLAGEDSAAAELVKLRYFVGMTMEEAAAVMGLKTRTAERLWSFARAWLRQAMRERA
jgi:RNA polymerase sigma factor (TIGR02999 family)